MKLGAMLAKEAIESAVAWLRRRRMRKALEAIRIEREKDAFFNAEEAAVFGDLGIPPRCCGKNPTTKITLRPRPEALVKASREQMT